MKIGDMVYVPSLATYGFIKDIEPNGWIVNIHSFNPLTKQFDIIKVIDLVVEAVGLFKRFIVIMKLMFPKKVKA